MIQSTPVLMRSFLQKALPLDQASDCLDSINDVDFGQWFRQSRSQQFQSQKTMQYNVPSFNVDDNGTITEGPGGQQLQAQACFLPWQTHINGSFMPFQSSEHASFSHNGLSIKLGLPESWNLSLCNTADSCSNSLPSPAVMMDNYAGNSLPPFPVNAQLSPSISDSTHSPMYSTSPLLSTPSTPASSLRLYSTSPALGRSGTIVDNNNQIQDYDTSVNAEKTQFTHREQLKKFREVFSLPMDGLGPFIPQKMYKPHTTSDRKRYVEEVLLDAPMFFHSESPSKFGVLLKDALQSRTKKMANRDQVVFEGRGPSVSIRLEWPGYRPWSRQIPTKDFRNPPGPITLSKLAKNVAKCVLRFIQDRKDVAMEEDADPRWRIGEGHNDIKLEDLVLVSMHHVSLGSWQPQLRLVRPREQRFNNSMLLNSYSSPMSSIPSSNTLPPTYLSR